MVLWLLFFAVVFLAFSNGANDNFKGVATLFGSRTTGYHRALWWATITTFAGSGVSLVLAQSLIKAFSGKALVPDILTTDPHFLVAVGAGAALTVLLATLTGMPISTTHALIGALVGAGMAAGDTVDFARLGSKFFLPLALSPLLSLALTGTLYPLLRRARLYFGVERQMCLCIEEGEPVVVEARPDGTAVLRSTGVVLKAAQRSQCEERYQGRFWGFDAQAILDLGHFLSAGMVGFARGLNDTPKIAALLVAGAGLGVSLWTSLLVVGLAMAVGGLLAAKKIAVTMSTRITSMNHGQGFTANLATAFLVIVASRYGVPVSTTHVSCGSLFGLGAVTGGARWGAIRAIALAWLVTLPAAACAAAVVFLVGTM